MTAKEFRRIVNVQTRIDPGTLRAERGRPLVIRCGKHLRGVFDRLISGSSLVSTAPVLDMRDFAWTEALREAWRDVRVEAEAMALRAEAGSFFLYGYGYVISENLARCPRTAALLAQVPGLATASFSNLAPGTHIPAHRGMTKGLVTCHLALVVPRDGDVRMRVKDRMVRWAEGETLVFDDTCDHEVWNDSSGTRVVLLIQFERPLRQPGKWIADLFLGLVKRSAFVREARRNTHRWNAAIQALDG